VKRWNPTQAELNRASACRAMAALEEHALTREAIRPLYWRRLLKLAALVASQPIGERRTLNRRARRAGRLEGVRI
jgi:hypothetical protein